MRVMDQIDRFFIYVGIICLFVIMVIVGIDGLLRQFFNAPIVGAYELIEKYLMVAMIFPAISYTWAKKGHIGVTLIYKKMPVALQNISHIITIILGLFIMGIIGYTGYETTYTAFAGNHLTSGLIRWPLWVSYVWMPIGSLIFCLRLLIELGVCLNEMRKNGLNKLLPIISD
jgi:TRAP-type C4-dicarboxylate transport system permease small subunit